MIEIGDKVRIVHPKMRPQYLNGAIVEITGKGPTRWTGPFASTPTETFEGRIVSMLTPRNAGRFYVGAEIRGIDRRVVERV